MDESFGHSTTTSRSHYGLTWNDLPSLHQDMISELFQVSARYWTWLNDQKALCEPQISYADIHEKASVTFNKLEAAAAEQTVIIKEAASNQKLIIDMLQSTHEKIDCQAVLITQCGSGCQSQSILQGLHLYLANPTAAFKSIQQAWAVEVISHSNPQVLIVMPTGAGKSAIYASPGYVENAGFRLVVLPYRSLLDQVIQDAKSKGLPYSTYPSPDIDLFQSCLIFVSLEHCADIEFQTWVKAVKASNLL